ncbi:sigma-70 family RNA polymerase sigma factor [Rubritalea tangerina]|uniref:Sigma-70 family RNA polymerase sigma factor n=1 Tax=Rubritalea tangerina TaxID=430798 RepID=A0ABW4ZAK7_9BACT
MERELQNESEVVPTSLGRYLDERGLEALDEGDKVRRYTEFYLRTRPALKAYLYAFLAGNDAAIEDCIQETGLVVWNKWDESWDLDAFQKYAFVTGKYKALSWLKKHKPAKKVYLSPALVERLADKSSELERDARLDSLQQCMDQLSPQNREILEARYESEGSKALRNLAEKMERSVDAIYKQLERLRSSLKDCVSRKSKLQQP